MKISAMKLPSIRTAVVALLANVALVGAAAAQAPTPAPAPASATSAPASAEMTKDGKPKAKMVRKECRASVKSQGLKGEARQKAVSDCVVKQRPDLAAKEQCRMDAKAKGLGKGDERKTFIKDCVKGKG